MRRTAARSLYVIGSWILTLCVSHTNGTAAQAQTCLPHPLFTDCTPPTAFSCPTDQVGPICPGEPLFNGPFGGGIDFTAAQLTIDQNCDGNPRDPVPLIIPVPNEIQSLLGSCNSCSVEYRLSPSQQYLYVRVFNNSGNVPGCSSSQNRIYFYEIDAANSALIPFTGDQGVCVPSPISIQPVFHDAVSYPVRTAVMVGAQNGTAPVLWADLVGRQLNLDSFSYSQGLQIPQFAPAGNVVLLSSIIGGVATEFSVVDLCASPVGGTGSVSTRTANGAVTGEITRVGGILRASINHGSSNDLFVLNECICGACCFADSCTTNVFAPHCGGTFFPGMTCSPSPCGGGGIPDNTLSVTVVGQGAVTSNIGGINCPAVGCDALYAPSATVNLTATPSAGRIFVGWSGDCSGTNPVESVSMSADRNCTATFRDPEADIQIADMSTISAPLIAGTTETYRVIVRNNGPETVDNFSISWTIPPGFTPVPNASNPGCGFFSCNVTTTLLPGEIENVDLAFAIDPDIRGDQMIQASVFSFLPDPNPSNNNGSTTSAVFGIADLAIAAQATPNPVSAGDQTIIQVSVSNSGPSTATALTHNRTYPSSVRAVDQYGTPTPGNPTLCEVSEVSVGGTNPAQFIVQIDPNAPAGSMHTVSLSVSSAETDPNLSNNMTAVILVVGGNSSALPNQRLITIADTNTTLPGSSELFTRFLEARIEGEYVVFTATSTSSNGNRAGIYRSIGTSVTAVADLQSFGPGYALPFESFANPILDGLNVYFDGIFLNPFNISGIYSQNQCGIENHFISGDPSPGLDGQIGGPVAQAVVNGEILFWDNAELLLWDGRITPVALRGASIPDSGGETFSSISSRSDYDGNTVVFQAVGQHLSGIYISQSGNLSKIVDTSDLRPDTGTPFDVFNIETAIDAGYAVFAQDLGTAAHVATIYGYDVAADRLDVIVGPNTPMPGGGRTFEDIFAPADTDDGKVYFYATGADFRGAGLYQWDNGNIRRVLARMPSDSLGRDRVDGNRLVVTQIPFFVPGELIIAQWGNPGDYDLNGFLDGIDSQAILDCFLGADNLLPTVMPGAAVDCLSAFDADADDDIDLSDLAIFQSLLMP